MSPRLMGRPRGEPPVGLRNGRAATPPQPRLRLPTRPVGRAPQRTGTKSRDVRPCQVEMRTRSEAQNLHERREGRDDPAAERGISLGGRPVVPLLWKPNVQPPQLCNFAPEGPLQQAGSMSRGAGVFPFPTLQPQKCHACEQCRVWLCPVSPPSVGAWTE